MSGNSEGAKKARDTLLKKDPNHFKQIGKRGGEASKGYEFAHGKVDPSVAGKIGGKVTNGKKNTPSEG